MLGRCFSVLDLILLDSVHLYIYMTNCQKVSAMGDLVVLRITAVNFFVVAMSVG